jgi:DNA-directed RNA polymerase subunit H (RpoH/RPB5)
MNSKKLGLYFKARNTCLDMLRDRKYDVPSYLFTLDEKTFNSNFVRYSVIDNITDLKGNKVLVVIFNGSDRVILFSKIYDILTLHVDNMTSSFKNDETNILNTKDMNVRTIILYDSVGALQNLSKLDRVYIGDPNQEGSMIEAFDINYMSINPTKHIYQPKWRLLSENEIIEVLQRYESKSTQLTKNLFPSVCIDDPINRYYGGKPPCKENKGGDMYEINRDGVSLFYRRVISKRMNL